MRSMLRRTERQVKRLTRTAPHETERTDEQAATSVARAPFERLGRSKRTAGLILTANGHNGSVSDPAPMARSGSRLEVALLGVWDLATVVLALAVTGAFGGGAAGVAAKATFCALALVVLSAFGVYNRTSWLREHPIETVGRLLLVSTTLVWIGVVGIQVFGIHARLAPLVITWLVLPAGWYLGRTVAMMVRRQAMPERVLIVGSGVVARRVVELLRSPGSASTVVGCLDDGDGVTADDLPLLGNIDQLPGILEGGGVDRVIVAFSSRRDYEILSVLRSATNYRGPIDIVPRFFDFVDRESTTYSADGLAFVSVPGLRATRGMAMLKRAVDILGSSLLLILLSPVLLLIALAVLIDSGRPVLFAQQRIGVHGTTFRILKFRTLKLVPDPVAEIEALELTPGSIGMHVEQAKREAAMRATRVGSVLRKTSLDELPNLFNVLVGQMSLVGPRPLSPLEDAVLDGWALLRRDVRPGITGLWQVSGRSEISWEHRIDLDYRQVRHWSLSSDLHVLADTVRAVLRRRGAE